MSLHRIPVIAQPTESQVRRFGDTSGGGGNGGGGGSGTYTNEPEGHTTIQQISDGTTKTIDGFGTWGSAVEVVDDLDNPIGTDKALRWTILSGERNGGVLSRSEWPSGPFTDFYVMLRINYEATWEEVGHKVWGYWGAHPDSRNNVSSPTQFYCTRESGRTLKITVQNSAPNTYNVLVINDAWPAPGTGYHELEVLAIGETLGGDADGICRVWMDGVLIGENLGVQWVSDGQVSQHQGLQWYANKNTEHTQDSHFRVGELYASGVAA